MMRYLSANDVLVLDIAEGKMRIGEITDWIKRRIGNLSRQNENLGG